MANTNVNAKVLPSATTYTTLYTVSENFTGNVIAANVSTSTAKIRIAMRPLGAAIDNSHFLIYDYILPAGFNFIIHGLALNSTDVITVYTDGSVAFNLFGIERT